MKYRAIAFDLGGVLLDCEEAHEKAARRAAEQFGLIVADEGWPRIRGGAYEGFFEHVLASPANADCGVRPMQVILRAYDFYHEEVQRSARLFPGVIEVLELSRATFEFVGVATSSEWRLVNAAIENFELREFFDGVVSGDHTTQKKPAPEAFLVTAWLLGINPGSMIAVEDSMHGIRAARRARAHVIGIATTKDPMSLLAADAHYVVRDHQELMLHIRKLVQLGRIAQKFL